MNLDLIDPNAEPLRIGVVTPHHLSLPGLATAASLASRWCRAALFFMVLLGMVPPRATAEVGVQPSGWDAGLKLTEAKDLNPDPHVVEINLEARLAMVEI